MTYQQTYWLDDKKNLVIYTVISKVVLLLSKFCYAVVDFLACSSKVEAPVIVFVSKMFPVDVRCFPQNRTR